jgi:hypothetical protein
VEAINSSFTALQATFALSRFHAVREALHATNEMRHERRSVLSALESELVAKRQQRSIEEEQIAVDARGECTHTHGHTKGSSQPSAFA